MVLDKILDAFWSWAGLASVRVWDCLVGLSDKILGTGFWWSALLDRILWARF